jgi:fructose-1,6-bisphosphatase/inositol monophosphatase family enzyme
VAAAGLIAERGGATVTNLNGGPWWQPHRVGPVMNVVAAPEPHHGEILRLLREAGTRVRTRR